MPRSAHKSGAALRYDRQQREDRDALAAQAAQVRSLREPRVDGGGESDLGIPISEQDQRVEVVPEARVNAPKPAQNMPEIMHRVPPPGTYRIADLRAGQCRFACTPHTALAEEHRFCGEPVAWLRGKPTSWCAQHLATISGAPGRHSGGASLADLAAGHAQPDQRPVSTGSGATGAQR